MKKLAVCMLALGLMLTGCGSNNSEPSETKDLSKVKIGAIQLAQHPALDKAYEGFQKTLAEAGISKDQIDYQNASGDASNCQTIAEKFTNDGVDLIYAIATDALQAAANKTTTIPVIGAAVTNFEEAGVVKSNEIPSAKKIAIFYCSDEANSVYQGNIAKEAATKIGLEPTIVTVPNDSSAISQVTESLIGKYDAVYIPTDNLLASNMATVAQITNANKIPCIVGEESMCKNGGIATLSLDYYTVGANAAKSALAILKGEAKPEETPVTFIDAKDCKYFVNKKVADQLGITIPTDLNATLIEE